MVRRPPRSTLTHSFPTRRSSDLRCGGEGLGQVARRELQALLPFTGEGARRADEGARAQRSVPSLSRGQALLPLRRRRAVSGSAAKHGRRPSPAGRRRAEPVARAAGQATGPRAIIAGLYADRPTYPTLITNILPTTPLP